MKLLLTALLRTLLGILALACIVFVLTPDAEDLQLSTLSSKATMSDSLNTNCIPGDQLKKVVLAGDYTATQRFTCQLDTESGQYKKRLIYDKVVPVKNIITI